MGQSYTYQCRPFQQSTSVQVTQGSTIQFWSGIVSGEIQLISRSQNISFTNSNTKNRFIQCMIGLSLKRREINFKARIPHTWYILILSMVKNIFYLVFGYCRIWQKVYNKGKLSKLHRVNENPARKVKSVHYSQSTYLTGYCRLTWRTEQNWTSFNHVCGGFF